MTSKKLLVITSDFHNSGGCAPDAQTGWEVTFAESLTDASRILRHGEFSVGLLVYDRYFFKTADVADFLRKNNSMQWVGLFSSIDIESSGCHDLILEHMCDYHTVPADSSRLAHTLGHALGRVNLERKRRLIVDNDVDGTSMIGNCEKMQSLRMQIRRVAQVTAPVLIWGESGTGKELTAQAIHTRSSRVAGPFVPVNCGAVSPTLIHSELFGYERGAFTGATQRKAGLIESAHGGTLFLDEIGDLPKDLQANLLRFLQEQTICRVGSTTEMRVDVRVIAASHVQLQEAVLSGAFREDLYYRLAVLPIIVPSLRDRRDDIVTLAEHVFAMHITEKSSGLKGFSDRAFAAMLDHGWPGNVRELVNRVRRAMIMSDNRLITPEDLGLKGGIIVSTPVALDDARTRSEQSTLRDCLHRNGKNVSRAARDLGISRTTMYRLLGKYGIRDSTGVY